MSVSTVPVRRLNIGIVSTWFERGAAHVSRAYMNALQPRHNVFVYARGGEHYARHDATWDSSRVAWAPPAGFWNFIPHHVQWASLRDWITKRGIDLLIFNEQQSWDIILRCLGLDVTLVTYVDYYTPRSVQCFWLYDVLLCNTRRHYGVFAGHPGARYIPWGTDCTVFTGSCERVAVDELVFFHSSGLSPYRKGTDILVRAFEHVRGPARLVIHTQEKLQDRATKSAIARDRRITVIEGAVGAPGLYHKGDVYVYPSRLEGIGLTIAEALASGLPVITTDAAPMNEFVEDGVNGRLVEVAEIRRRNDDYFWPETVCAEGALVEAMEYYVERRESIATCKKAARQDALLRLNWERNAAGLSDELACLPRLEKPWRLVLATAAYEYGRYPKLFGASAMRKLDRWRQRG